MIFKTNQLSKEFLKNIILLVGINLIIKPVYIFGIDAQVQNEVGANGYGDYFSLFGFCFLLQFFLDFGIQNQNTTYLSKNRDLVKQTFKHTLGSKIILSSLFSAIVWGFGIYIIGYEDRFISLLPFVIGIMILNSTMIYLRSHFSILGHYTTDSLFSVLDKVLLILIVGYQLYLSSHTLTILDFVRSYVFALLLANIVVAFVLSIRYRFFGVSFSFTYTKNLIKKSLPYGLVFLFMTLYTRMDGFMLERLLDDESYSAGVYAAGYRIYDALNMIGYLFAGLLLPMFANLISKNKSVNTLIDLSRDLMLTIAISGSLLTIFFSDEIMHLVYTDANELYGASFRWLMGSFFFICLGYVYGTLITAGGKLKAFNVIFVAGIVLNWGLNLILIPKMQAEGAAIATYSTQSFVVIAQIILAYKLFGLTFSISSFLRTILLIVLLIVAIYLLKSYLALNWMYILGLAAIICGIIPFIIGQLSFTPILSLLKERINE